MELDGTLLRNAHPNFFALRDLSKLRIDRVFSVLAVTLLLLLFTSQVSAASRIQEFLPKAQPGELIPGADRFGPPQGDPPLVPAYQGDRLVG